MINKKITIVSIAAIIGAALIGFALFNIPTSDKTYKERYDSTNTEFMTGAAYRHIVGYESVCKQYDYEMQNYPDVFRKLYDPELAAVSDSLAKQGKTLEDAWSDIDPALLEILDTSIERELDAMRKALTVSKVAELSNIPPQNISWTPELDSLMSISDVCMLFDTNAEMVIGGNLTLQEHAHMKNEPREINDD